MVKQERRFFSTSDKLKYELITDKIIHKNIILCNCLYKFHKSQLLADTKKTIPSSVDQTNTVLKQNLEFSRIIFYWNVFHKRW